MKYERDRSGKQPSLAHIYFIYSYILQFQSDYYLDHKRKARSFRLPPLVLQLVQQLYQLRW